jgi:serine/threonine protein kinase
MPSPITCADLLKLVRQSNLIAPDKLQGFLSEADNAAPAAPSQLASSLVRKGLLTQFQAAQLLRGKHRGFELGKYRVLQPIAEGGMGRVYLCEHIQMGHRVAIKLLYPDSVKRDPLALARFQREARAAAQLNHPNVIRTHDIDQFNGHHFLVMDYLEGITLYDLVRRQGALAVEEAVVYAIQTGLGLQHIHENSLVHRDLKPSNLLLDRTGKVKILDLGLAVFRDDRHDYLTRKQDSNAILGTADFLAPEQALSSDVDIRADIYSLGCVLYFLLTAKFPFGDMPLTRKLLSLHMASPTPIQEHRPNLPPALVQVVNQMMARSPDNRYRTPLAAVHALAPFAPVAMTLPPLAADGNPPSEVITRAEASSEHDTKTDLRSQCSSSSGIAPSKLILKTPAPKARPRTAKPRRKARRKSLLYGAVIAGVILALVTTAILALI